MRPETIEALKDCDELVANEGLDRKAFQLLFSSFLAERGIENLHAFPPDAIRSYVSQYVGLIKFMSPKDGKEDSATFIYRSSRYRW